MTCSEKLKKWFLPRRRDLPWRRFSMGKNRDAYQVWISEIMLQQTRVETVVSYFERWILEFPTIEELSIAEEERVLKMWQGLGYYSRARNIHKTAKIIKSEYKGELPKNRSELLNLPGIGEYTAGAILSLAYLKKEAILDGNLIRVFSRYYGEEVEHWKSHGKKWMWEKAWEWVQDESPEQINEALMELGATVCKIKNPKCQECPLSKKCISLREGSQECLPLKKPKTEKVILEWCIPLILEQGKLLLIQKKENALLKNQWRFPQLVASEKESWLINLAPMHRKKINDRLLKHSITNHKINAAFELWQGCEAYDEGDFEWVDIEKIKDRLVSSLHSKGLTLLKDYLKREL